VSKKFFPKISFSRLKVETTTPSKRSRIRKLPKKTNTIKKRDHARL
jgi:hypothetical protein